MTRTQLKSSASDLVIIRCSSLSGYADCPRRSAARLFKRYIEEAGYTLREESPGVGMAIGVGVHASAAHMLKEKATSGNLPKIEDLEEIGMDAFRERATPGLIFSRDTVDMNGAELQVRRLTRSYRATIAPSVNPILVEERLEAQVTPTLVLSGQPDVLAREPGKVRDLKSGTNRPNCKPQVGGYGLLAKSNGIPVTEAVEDFVQRVNVKKPQPDGKSYTHSLAAAETAARNVLREMDGDLHAFRFGDVERKLVPGDPWAFLANPMSKLCGAKYCPAHGTDFCREHMTEEESE